MEVVIRKVWLPVKVLQKKPDPFQPTPVIYKPKRVNFNGTRQNVIYKIPGSAGKCYEYAFVRAFSRMEAEKYVCCGCRVLKVKNDPRSKGKKVPWIQIQKGMFLDDPVKPSNSDHFCRPKVTVDVLHGGHMSTLRNAVLFTPNTRGTKSRNEEPKSSMTDDQLDVSLPDDSPPVIMDEWLRIEHCYAGTEKKRSSYPRISKTFQAKLAEKAVRIPSVGPKRIIFKVSEEQCYEFVEKKTRSVYFDVYHCTACSRKKDLEGHRVGPIPAVHLRGDEYMTDPCNPKHPHYCSPKNVAEVLVLGEMARILHENQEIPIETQELFVKLREKCRDQDNYIRAFEQDKMRVQALEKKLLNRNIAIKMSEERVERIAKEKAEGKQPTPPPTLEKQIQRDSLSPERDDTNGEFSRDSRLSVEKEGVESKPSNKRNFSTTLNPPPLKRMSSMPILEPITSSSSNSSINFCSKQPTVKVVPKKSTISNVNSFLPARTSQPSIVQKCHPQPMLFPVRVVPREEIRRATSLPTKEKSNTKFD